ncbi:unnamed protein product [Sphagnum jensenii]
MLTYVIMPVSSILEALSSQCCNCLFHLFGHCCWCRKRIVLVLLGLDGAGKSTLLAKLCGEDQNHVIPTWGFDKRTWNTRKFQASIYDLGGGKNIRGIWSHYFAEVYGSIFVLDASNDLRMLEVANEFKKVVKDAHLNGKPMLVVANKRDLSFDLPTSAILGVLGPINSTYQAFIECNCSLLNNVEVDQQLNNGLEWLLETIQINYTKLHSRVKMESTIQKEKEYTSIIERQEETKGFKARKATMVTLNTQSQDTKSFNMHDQLQSNVNAKCINAWIGSIDIDPTMCTYKHVNEKGQEIDEPYVDYEKFMQPLMEEYDVNVDEPNYTPNEIIAFFGKPSDENEYNLEKRNLPGQTT